MRAAALLGTCSRGFPVPHSQAKGRFGQPGANQSQTRSGKCGGWALRRSAKEGLLDKKMTNR